MSLLFVYTGAVWAGLSRSATEKATLTIGIS